MKTRSKLRAAAVTTLVSIQLIWCGTGVALAASKDQDLVNVSMISLLASPEKYDGVTIRTFGFIVIQLDSDAIYLHQEDYRYGLYKNSYSVDLSEAQREKFKNLNLKYVLIEGTVHTKSPDATYMCSGTIASITRLEAWGPWTKLPRNPH
jgi:hypothetical protein